jgi:hypothetical protein
MDLQLPIQSVSITTKIVNSNPAHGEVYSMQLENVDINLVRTTRFWNNLHQVRS